MSNQKKLYLNCLDETQILRQSKVAKAIICLAGNILLIACIPYSEGIIVFQMLIGLFIIFLSYEIVMNYNAIVLIDNIEGKLEESFMNFLANNNEADFYEEIRKIKLKIDDLE